MSNAIQLHQPTLEDELKIAETFAKAQICAEAFRGKPADAYMAICYGRELGLPPATSISSIAVIKGKPSLYAASMVALVLGSDKCKYFSCVESTATSCTYETQRHGDPNVQRKTFTMQDAKAAGLAGGMYSKYPQRMLEARAKAALAKDVYPDVLHGLSSYEEIVDEPDTDAITAEFEEPASPDEPEDAEQTLAPVLERMLACKGHTELNEMASELKGIEKGSELYTQARKLFSELQEKFGDRE